MKSMDIIEKFSGKRPRGWFGPGLTQTFDTLDYLSEAGVEYIGDWVLDDEPVTLKTTHRPVVALPYNFEIHDIVLMALQHHTSDVMYARARDQFEWLYAEAAERPKIMAIATHPYLSGVPHPPPFTSPDEQLPPPPLQLQELQFPQLPHPPYQPLWWW